MSTGTFTVSANQSVATQVVWADGIPTLIINTDLVNTIYISENNSAQPADGNDIVPIGPNGSIVVDGTRDFFAVTASVSPVVIATISGGMSTFLGITNGNGQLAIPALVSPNYVAGSSGWRIGKDGKAEFNTVTAYGNGPVSVNLVGALPASGDTSGATDWANITSFLAAGQTVQLLPQVYYINNGLNPTAKSGVRGIGREATTIRQVSSLHTGFSFTNANGVTLEGFTLVGPSAGTANGISGSGSPMDFLTLRNVKVQSFGGSGVNLGGGIISRLEGVVSELNGINGISLFSSPTSTVLDNCYANANGGAGYRISGGHYIILNGCGCDNNTGGGYVMQACTACVINACNAQSNTGTTEQVSFSNGNSNIINGLFIDNTTVAQSVNLVSETFATLTGLVEISPVGATAFIKTDVNSSCVVINDKHTTPNSFAAGTCYEILPTGAIIH